MIQNSGGIGSLLDLSAGTTYLPAFSSVIGTGATNLLFGVPIGASGTVLTSQGTTYPTFSASGSRTPTFQKFTTGSGTYITPTPTPLYLKIKMSGAGGGGGGGTGTSFAVGNIGSTTMFGTCTCGGGAGGGSGGGSGNGNGQGGGAALGSSFLGINLAGGWGQGADFTTSVSFGGQGGVNPFGGSGGGGGSSSNGRSGALNTGAGGGGGGGNALNVAAGGGGAGGYIEAILTSPGATYSYAVGTGGTGGTGSISSGGNGADGILLIEEHYQ